MARTTATQFARQLRRLGANVTIRQDRDGRDVVAAHRGIEVTAHFTGNVDAFDVARRTDTTAATDGDAADAGAIRTMAGVRRVLSLPTHPVVTLGTTGRRNSRIHILAPGWSSIAECGVSMPASTATARRARRPARAAAPSGDSGEPRSTSSPREIAGRDRWRRPADRYPAEQDAATRRTSTAETRRRHGGSREQGLASPGS